MPCHAALGKVNLIRLNLGPSQTLDFNAPLDLSLKNENSTITAGFFVIKHGKNVHQCLKHLFGECFHVLKPKYNVFYVFFLFNFSWTATAVFVNKDDRLKFLKFLKFLKLLTFLSVIMLVTRTNTNGISSTSSVLLVVSTSAMSHSACFSVAVFLVLVTVRHLKLLKLLMNLMLSTLQMSLMSLMSLTPLMP